MNLERASEALVATDLVKAYDVGSSLVSSVRAESPVMDETKPTSAPTSTARDRLAGFIMQSAKGQAPLLGIALLLASAPLILGVGISIVRGEPVGIGVREIVALTSVLALAFLVLFGFVVVLPALMAWSGFDAGFHDWAGRRAEKARWKRLLALGEVHKAPFHFEQRCKLSPAEEVWVRRAINSRSNQLEVLHTTDSGQTWERLPLRLSPWAWLKCIAYQGEWPATPRTRHLSCDKDSISFEILDLCADNWETWPIVWRTTYRPGWKWWTLKAIGPPWPGTLSQGTGTPADALRPKNV